MTPNKALAEMMNTKVTAVINGEAFSGTLIDFDAIAYVIQGNEPGFYIVTRNAVDVLMPFQEEAE